MVVSQPQISDGHLPTAQYHHAVWVGIGAVGTAVYGMLVLGEDRGLMRIMCFALIIAGIVGLKLLSPK